MPVLQLGTTRTVLRGAAGLPPQAGPSLRKPLHADCSSPRAHPHKDAKPATTLSALNVGPLFRMVLRHVRRVLPSPETSEDLK